ncbi:pig-Q [Thecaphora frezii]
MSPAPPSATMRMPTSVLVFWPQELVELGRPLSSSSSSSTSSPSRHGAITGYLVGRVLTGAPHELAIVLLGIVTDVCSPPRPPPGTQAAIVGTFRVPSSEGGQPSTAPPPSLPEPDTAPVWLDVRLPASAFQRPSWLSWQRRPPVRIRIRSLRFAFDNPEDQTATITPTTAISVFYYDAPKADRLRYYALEPLRLGPVSGARLTALGPLLLDEATVGAFLEACDRQYEASELQRKLVRLLMLDPARWSELLRDQPAAGRWPEGSAFRSAIACVNGARRCQREWMSDAVDGEASSSSSSYKAATASAAAIASRAWPMVETPLCIAGRSVRRMLHAELTFPGWRGRRASLVTVSAAARQLDMRLSQLLLAPRLGRRLRVLRQRDLLSTEELAAPYIGLWNGVWLIANDIILGYAARQVLLHHHAAVAAWLGAGFQRVFLDDVLRLLAWLCAWPAGLKLNTELALFWHDAYATLVTVWCDTAVQGYAPRFETVVCLVSISSRLGGATMALCVLSDCLSLYTLHVTLLYGCARRTFRLLITVVLALSDLFRGKKRNALRGGRLDEASYDLDQLLLGTILFTLCAFLMPTCYVFYLAFAVLRLAVVLTQAATETVVATLNHLPLFAMMLCVKDPKRVPKGVCLVPLEGGGADAATNHWRLGSRALGLKDVFEGYEEHVRGLVRVPRLVGRGVAGLPL